MGAVTAVVARCHGVGPTYTATGVNGVVPVKIVVRGGAIPAAILRLKRDMGPALARVLVTDYYPLAGMAHCPHCRCVNIVDPPLHRGRNSWIARRNFKIRH